MGALTVASISGVTPGPIFGVEPFFGLTSLSSFSAPTGLALLLAAISTVVAYVVAGEALRGLAEVMAADGLSAAEIAKQLQTLSKRWRIFGVATTSAKLELHVADW